jgi:hypothetical protein
MVFSMTKEFSQSAQALKHAADISHTLADQVAELLKLREAVQNAEEAATRKEAKTPAGPGRRRRKFRQCATF